MIAINIIIGIILLLTLFWQTSLLFSTIVGAPTVYANNKAIRDAYKLANLKKGDLVLDLGCGNAKSLIIAAKEFGAKGVGIEISPYCYIKSKINILFCGQKNNIIILYGNFDKAQKYLARADVVYLYLLNSVLKNIEDWYFETISKKTRTVVLSFEFSKRKPTKIVKTNNLGKCTTIKLY